MIYLSHLSLNSDSRQVRSELGDPYQMHRTLCKAFGNGDGELIAARPLFRVSERRNGDLSVLVQSLAPPDWARLTVTGTYLAESPQVKPLDLRFRTGQRLRFLLRANPTVRRVFDRPAQGGKPTGKRIGVYGEEAQREWLARKGEAGGFRVSPCEVNDRGFLVSRKRGGEPIRHLWVEYTGMLEVTQPDRFLSTLASGLGSAKAFGFGLLSLARA